MIGIILSIISGAMLFLVFPNFNLYYLSYIALIPLIYAVKKAKNYDDPAVMGFICGVIYFGGTFFWINILSKWADRWAYLGWFALAIFQGLFIAFFAYLFKLSIFKFKVPAILSAPLLWALVEWLRSLGPYGVTGGGLAYSQVDILPLIQIAQLLGPYAVSFVVVMINVAILELLTERKADQFSYVALFCIIILLFGFFRVSTYKPTGRAMSVAVIQANISQDVKLDYGLAYEIVETHDRISRQALELKPDMVIWPETAVTTYLFETKTILSMVERLVKDSKTYYLIGTPYRHIDKIYNSVVAFSPDGKVIGRYDKQRLVPFGEYLPFRYIFYRLMQGNPLFAEDYNSNPKPVVIDIGGTKAGVVICFESTFPSFVRDKVKKGAKFIVVATNDAWFFDSGAVQQHVQSARMRAVENNMYVVQAANTGISAIIDPLGRVVKSTKVGDTAVLFGQIYIH